MQLRKAVAADAETIALLHTASWREAYSNVLDATYLAGPVEEERLAHWKSELVADDAGQRVILAEDADSAVGFICVGWPGDPAWGAWVDNLHVSRASRGKGAGKQLLKAAAAWVTGGGEIVEKSSSQIRAANGAPIIRVWWRRAAHLLNC